MRTMRTLLYVLAIILGLSALGWAQTGTTLVGTVTDESKAVLPGATVTATEVSTGRPHVAVTDERGEFRLPSMQAGTYRIQAELSGFSTVVFTQVELLVGQNRTIAFVLKVATVQETVTVTGDAPLIDTQSTQVAGNIDRRQMEELPISGRNWMELTMLVKGVTANDIASRPADRDSGFQLNLDGQQITQQVAGTGNAPDSGFAQPGLSREAIAEYQIVTNLFDITQGRSTGIQVQAISRAGTNTPSGSLYGYFRDDSLNSADFIARRVVPYQNQQIGGAFGGPIVRDRIHYFATYEYEREPNTFITRPTGYSQTISLPTSGVKHNTLIRGDYQMSPKDRLMLRFTKFNFLCDFCGLGGDNYPTTAASRPRDNWAVSSTWSRAMSSTMVSELIVGWFHYHWNFDLAKGQVPTPSYGFPGVTIASRNNYPQEFWQNTPSVKYDLSWHRGKHDVKIGGEFLRWVDTGWWRRFARGTFAFSARPADIERRFPLDAWNDPSRWDLSGLDPLVLRFTQTFAQEGGGSRGNCPNPDGCGSWSLDIPRPTWGIWIGDTWAVTDRMTVNFGVRWDVDWGALSPPLVNETDVIINNGYDPAGFNIGYRNGIRDLNNVAPRGGFNYNVGGAKDLVIRGGTGLYYGVPTSEMTFQHQLFNGQRVLNNEWANDGLPGFIQDPTRGVTSADVFAGRVALPPQAPSVISQGYQLPYTWQSVLGVQKALGSRMSVDADLTYARGYDQSTDYDPNLFYDPVTGYNLHPTRFGRPDPQYGGFTYYTSNGWSKEMLLATSFTRRYANNFQAGATYTHMFYKNDTNSGSAGYGGGRNNNFCLPCEYGRASGYQRHTFRANGIYRAPLGITLAGTYLAGSGNYFNSTTGLNVFGSGSNRRRADGTLVPRNNFKGRPLHKVDLRVSKEFRLAGSLRLSGIAEVFNVFNHENYGSYQLQEGLATYGTPNQNVNNSYRSRTGQLAFRLSF